MSHVIDVSFLDKSEILQKVFPMALSFDFSDVPQSDPNADAYFIDVDKDVRLCCKFYTDDYDSPSILYFHGNSENALNQGELGSHFVEMGINFFVTDYRGYGISDGTPTMTNLFQDCHQIYDYFKKLLKKEKYNPAFFVMGRSLGSMPAVELAYHYPQEIKGLIIESGSGQNFKALWSDVDAAEIQKLAGAKFYNKDKIKEITMPTLFIHGDADNLIPVQIGKALYDLSPAKDKQLVIIPGAGHNDLKDVGYDEYYSAIEQFIKKTLKPKRSNKVSSKASRSRSATVKSRSAESGTAKSSRTKTVRSKSKK